MNLELYLRRINYSGELREDLPTLRALVHHHVFNIPFEIFDIHSRTPISLQIDAIFRKVVLGYRGGYCFELNILFHRLLQKCGFTVSMVSGRLLHGHGYGPEFEHLALVVELDGKKWLVDVGYGDFSLQPLALEPDQIQSDGRTFYQVTDKIIVDGQTYLGVVKWNHSKQAFRTEYIFTLIPRVEQEFAGMNHFHQTSPASHFARRLICTLPTREGRITLINNKLIRTENGKKQVKVIQNLEHREKLLEKYFHFDAANVPLAATPHYIVG